MMRRQTGAMVLLGVLGGGWLAAQAATPEGSTALEEIIVTAQRRSESLQEVPLSITAMGAEALEQKAVNTFFDYAGQVPNLAFANTGDGSGTSRTISIRGISGDGTTGFYIDETPVPDSIDPRVLDVERIEVLRGPQGTLYGARSMGGTVRLITQQPDFEQRSGRISVNGSKTANAASANYGVDGAFNLPLGAAAALRAVAFYQHDGGFFKRRFLSNPADAATLSFDTDPTELGALPTTTRDDIGRVRSYGGAVSVAIKAGPAWTITPRLMYQKAESNGFLYSDAGTYPVPFDPEAPLVVSMRPGSLTQHRFYDIGERSSDEWTLGSLAIKYEGSKGTFLASSSYFDRTVDETEDQTDFLWQNLLAPFDGIPLGDINDPEAPPYHAVPIASNIRELKQIHRFVQELRYTSSLAGPWQYVAGLFYSDTRGRVPYAGYYPPSLAPGISQTGGFVVTGLEELGLPIPVNPANPDEIFGSDANTKVTEPALYGELSYLFNDTLKVTGGLRAYRVKTTTRGYLEGVAFGGARLTDPEASLSESGVNPKLGVDWKLGKDQLLYLQAARGFRPGGLVPSIPGNANSDPLGCFGQLQALGYTSADQTKRYKSDRLWSYEVGGKSAWFDNRLTVNGAAFYIKWDQIQQLVALRCGFQFRANSGAATIKGAELEVHARPTRNLDVTLGGGYQRARISQGSPLLPALQAGDRVYQVPDWTGNASLTYMAPLAGERALVGSLSWTYTGDTVSASVDTNNPRVRPSYSILDARLALRFGAYEAALVGKNLTDELANLGDNRSLAAETIGRPRLMVNTPRTLGVELRAQF